MKLAVAFVVCAALLAGDSTTVVAMRGKSLSLTRMGDAHSNTAVMFLPGDGGWRGTAVSVARTIASWGYDVFGFDTKRYLEMFSEGGAKLTPQELAGDVRSAAAQVAAGHQRVILIGWSQGASMAVAAAASAGPRVPIKGVLTLGLPESGVLGWDWKATMAILARRTPDQPVFPVQPLLAQLTPRPIWMIHGSEDEYTPLPQARSLFRTASEPKRMEEISGANHRFDGRQDELHRSLQKGLEWITAR